MTSRSYLIIGCGHFGSRAIEKLLKKNPHSKITVVDKDEKAFRKVSSFPIETVVGEGISHLQQFLLKDLSFDDVIPSVPFHLAFEFLLSNLRPIGAKRNDVPILRGLPNPIRGKTGDLYTSIAHFLCPEDCPEPPHCCPKTGERRREPLFKMLMDLTGPFASKVIRSRPLGPGVGGFRTRVLVSLLEEIEKQRTGDRLILISTASRCHGVTSALSFGFSPD